MTTKAQIEEAFCKKWPKDDFFRAIDDWRQAKDELDDKACEALAGDDVAEVSGLAISAAADAIDFLMSLIHGKLN